MSSGKHKFVIILPPILTLLTVDDEEYVQQTNKKNWTLHSKEQKSLE